MINLLLKQCLLQIDKHAVNITPEKLDLYTHHASPSTLKIILNKPLALEPNTPINITIKLDNQKTIYFKGIITHIMQTLKPKTQQTIIAKTLDHKLTLQKTNHVYHQYSLEKLINSIYKKHQIHYSLNQTTNSTKTYNQLNQTDYDFLQQRLQENRLAYYHDHIHQQRKLIITEQTDNNIASHISIIKTTNTNNPNDLRYHFNQIITSNNKSTNTPSKPPTLQTAKSTKINNAIQFDFENSNQYQQTTHTELFAQHHAGSSFSTDNHQQLLINFIASDPNQPIIIGSVNSRKIQSQGILQKNNNIKLDNQALSIYTNQHLNFQAEKRGIAQAKSIGFTANEYIKFNGDDNTFRLNAGSLNIHSKNSKISLTNDSICFDSAFISIN